MNNTRELIQSISNQFGIIKGNNETDTSFYCRIIYSVAGIMGYASLYDEIENAETSSLYHLKERVYTTIQCYIDLIPEAAACSPKEMADEIYNVFLQGGMIYHSNYRCAPARKRQAVYDNIVFLRGVSIGEGFYVSGIGAYDNTDNNLKESDDAREMFLLQNASLEEYWNSILVSRDFRETAIIDGTEYLRTDGRFGKGYWTEKPDRGMYSLARVGGVNGKYYAYRYADTLTMAPIEERYVENYKYRAIANGILKHNKKLPPAIIKKDGDIIRLKVQYLYPPAELNFLKLYSWPLRYDSFPNDFERIYSKEVFLKIKEILEEVGYEFLEG